MKVLSRRQIRELDEYAINNCRISGAVLMENAGRAVFESVFMALDGKIKGKKILVFCGKGNNGGDGFVAARHLLHGGAKVNVVLLGKSNDLSGDALTNYRVYKSYGGKTREIVSEKDLRNAAGDLGVPDLIIDAIFGTGLKNRVSGVSLKAIKYMNGLDVTVISVDIPSGLDTDTGFSHGDAVRADVTVTFGYPKLGLLVGDSSEYVGDLFIRDISLPRNYYKKNDCVELIEPEMVRSLLTARKPNSNKGSFGHVLIIAGSREKSGAAKLAAIAALRGGAGLVTLAVPESAHDLIKRTLYNVMTLPLPDNGKGAIRRDSIEKIMNLAGSVSVIAVGPGISPCMEVADLINVLIKETNIPLIIDADGLNSIARYPERVPKGRANVVVTPHPGEMSRLAKISTDAVQRKRIETALGYSARKNMTVVLKGHRSVIAFPDGSVFINPTGNPGMAVAGMGDVLTGLISSYISQGADFRESVISSVFNHGLLGDIVAAEFGERGIMATDLVNKLLAINKTLYPGKRGMKIEEL